jgi:hypothetical protein
MATPAHRKYPSADELTDDNEYIREITEMRARTRTFQDSLGTSQEPIGFAIDNIEGFVSSGSNWQREHLNRFQVVVFDNQYARAMFPVQYIPQNDDDTIKALDVSGFFHPSKDDIVQGNWDSSKIYNHAFLDILGLLRDDSPARNVTLRRTIKSRVAKESARVVMKEIIAADAEIGGESRALTKVMSSESLYSASASIQSQSMIHYGPRETLTHSLLHNWLKTLATYEVNNHDNEKMWLSR